MAKSERRRFTEEFRREPVRLTQTSGRTVDQVADDLGDRFNTNKADLIWRTLFQTRQQAERALGRYLDGFYNPLRRHSPPGYVSPIAFGAAARKAEAVSLH